MTADVGFTRWPSALFFLVVTAANLNAQGLAEIDDLATLLQRHEELNIPRGDVNEDGSVDFPDFLIMSANYGMPISGYSNGDLNLDGTVGLGDYAFLTNNFGESTFTPDPPSILATANLGLSIDGSDNIVVSSATPVEIAAIELIAPNEDLVSLAASDSSNPFPFYLARDAPRVTWASLASSVMHDGDWNTQFGAPSGEITVRWIEWGNNEVFSRTIGEGDPPTGRQAFPPPVPDPQPPMPNPPNAEIVALLNAAQDEASLIAVHQEHNVPRGDTEANGHVGFADFLILTNNFTSQVSSYAEGDFNLDGIVSLEDFAILGHNFDKEGYQPEPPVATRVPLSLSLDPIGRMVIESSEPARLPGIEVLSEDELLIPARESDPFPFSLFATPSQVTAGHVLDSSDVGPSENLILPARFRGRESSDITLRWIQEGSYEVFEDTFSLEFANPSSLGDIDGDGWIAFPDFLMLSSQYGTEVAPFTGADIDGDGQVQFTDFVFLSAFFGEEIRGLEVSPVPVASVPEPSGRWLCLLSLVAIRLRRSRVEKANPR